MKKILIRLPKNRWSTGELYLYDDKNKLMLPPIPARGKADNEKAVVHGNPSRDPTRPYGDTPSGDYTPTHIINFPELHERLGPAWIPIKGVSGDALTAVENGRTGIGIHGGAGNDRGRLRATYGCVRITDIDFAHLAFAIGADAVGVTVQDTSS